MYSYEISTGYPVFIGILILIDSYLIYKLVKTPGFSKGDFWILRLVKLGMICAISDAVAVILPRQAGRFPFYLINVIYDICFAGIGYLLFYYTESVFSTNKKKDQSWFILTSLPYVVTVLITVSTYWNGWLFTIDQDGYFHRGPFHLPIFVCLIFFYCFVILFRTVFRIFTKRYENEAERELLYHAFWYTIPIFLGGLMQLYMPAIPFPNVGFTIAFMLVFVDSQQRLYVQTIEKERSASDPSLDSLTGVLNRTYGALKIDAMIKSRSFHQGLFVIVDLDNFKEVNDKLGHQKGDETLRFMAHTLEKQFSENGIVCRIGGDEFIIFLNTEDRRAARRELEKLRESMRLILQRKNGYSHISASFGVIEVPEYGKSFEELYAKADKALLASKQEGKNRITDYRSGIEERDPDKEIVAAFEEALERQYIQVYYQPVIRTISGDLCSMEALARWIDPAEGMKSPAYFIPVLEEKQLIHKLDLYIIRKICERLQLAQSRGEPSVPISFNLSRYDFLACDIFDEVDHIVTSHDIPRDMINVEITESLMMENPTLFHQEVTRFQKAGYQVWMDDFGSGYSSLNVLKDFSFDEIKLDMVFLKSFDERTKQMIRSIIAMAKRMNIHTLAEGVETREQYEFLRNIGCEKVQGYYLGKPLPYEDALLHCREDNRGMEGRGWVNYYDKLGEVDFMTDRPLILLDYDGENFNVLFINQICMEVWLKAGMPNVGVFGHNINSPHIPIGKQIRSLQKNMKVGESRDMDYVMHGHQMRAHAKILLEYQNHTLSQVEITDLSQDVSGLEDRRAQAIQIMNGMYDLILILDFPHNTFDTLMKGNFHGLVDSELLKTHTLGEIHVLLAQQYIHPDDRKEYVMWAKPAHARNALIQSGAKESTRYFRTRLDNGGYVWKAHTIMYVPNQDYIIYSMKSAPLLQDGLLQKLLPEGSSISPKGCQEKKLWKTIMESRTINMFWKDKERRFVGVNHHFLQTYGFSSVEQVLGKTDEDMHWHIDDRLFQDDEKNVLENGVTILNRPGRCIINGETVDILATKEPLYEDGKIVGLFGFFILARDIGHKIGAEGIQQLRDPITNLPSASSTMSAILDYIENWQLRQEDFVIISIELQRYIREVHTYGEAVGQNILRRVADIIREESGFEGNAARLYNGHFVILRKGRRNDEAIADYVHSLRNRIEGIREVDGYRVTLQATLRESFASEAANIQELLLITAGEVDPTADSTINPSAPSN